MTLMALFGDYELYTDDKLRILVPSEIRHAYIPSKYNHLLGEYDRDLEVVRIYFPDLMKPISNFLDMNINDKKRIDFFKSKTIMCYYGSSSEKENEEDVEEDYDPNRSGKIPFDSQGRISLKKIIKMETLEEKLGKKPVGKEKYKIHLLGNGDHLYIPLNDIKITENDTK